MKKVLIIGSDGMLGGELKDRLSKIYEVYSTTIDTMDICNKDSVVSKLDEIKPYFVINCAAFTNVDACETNYELAEKVNGYSLENISYACNLVDATLIHISTDYVFDGDLDTSLSYTEDMEPNPYSAYGKTKLLGEINAAKANKYYILRTAWLYGKGKNFVKTMINLSKERNEVNVVCDQHGSPTSTTTLCDIIEQILKIKPEYGIYHSTNEGFTTWSEFAKDIFKLSNIKMKVNAVTSDKYPAPTKRPFNSKLSKLKLNSIGIYPKDYIVALQQYINKEEF